MPAKARRHPHFLKTLARHGVASVAADDADLDLDDLIALRASDPDFAHAWTAAERLARDRLIAVAYDRAINGVARPLHGAGKLTVDAAGQPVTVAEHDTKLLLAMLEHLAGLGQAAAPSPRWGGMLPPVRIVVTGPRETLSDEEQ